MPATSYLLGALAAALVPSLSNAQLSNQQCALGCQNAITVIEHCPSAKTSGFQAAYSCLTQSKAVVDTFFECVACNNAADAPSGTFIGLQYIAEVCYVYISQGEAAAAEVFSNDSEQEVIAAFSATLLPVLRTAQVTGTVGGGGTPAPTPGTGGGGASLTPVVQSTAAGGGGGGGGIPLTGSAGGGGGGAHTRTKVASTTQAPSTTPAPSVSLETPLSITSSMTTNAAIRAGDMSLGYWELSIIGFLGMLFG